LFRTFPFKVAVLAAVLVAAAAAAAVAAVAVPLEVVAAAEVGVVKATAEANELATLPGNQPLMSRVVPGVVESARPMALCRAAAARKAMGARFAAVASWQALPCAGRP
jgi:hypothetical protein